MSDAKRDNNRVPTLIAVSNVDGTTPVLLWADPVTHRLLVSASSGMLGDLTDVTLTAEAQGDILYYNGSAWVNLGVGTSGEYLKTQGIGANPTWDTPVGGDVSKVGTPLDNQVGVWTGDGTIEGTVNLTYDGANLLLTGDIGITGTRITKGWLVDLEVTNTIVGSINSVIASNAAGPAIADEAATTSNPTLIPNKAEMDTGIGWASDEIAIVLGGSAQYSFDGSEFNAGGNNFTNVGTIGITGTRVTKIWVTDLEITNAIVGSITGNAATVTTNANLTGDVTSIGNATTIGASKVTEAMQVLDDNTTNDVSITKHGYAPKGTNTGSAFLRDDGTWAVPAGSGDVSKVGTPADSQIGVWTGDGTIEGTSGLTYDGSNLLLTGDIGITGTRITKGWFADLTVTNAIAGSITGNAATVTGFTPASGSLILSGADALTLTTTAATNVTLPTTGTLATTTNLADYLPLAGGTMTGDIQLGETDIKLDAVLSGDEKWSGITIVGTAGATLAVGDVCYLGSAGKWLLVDGILDGTDTGFSKQLGMCVLAGNDTDPTEMLVNGKIRSATLPALTVGAPVYLSDTAGDLIVTQPSTTNFAIRVVGHGITAEDLYFNPSPDYIVHV